MTCSNCGAFMHGPVIGSAFETWYCQRCGEREARLVRTLRAWCPKCLCYACGCKGKGETK